MIKAVIFDIGGVLVKTDVALFEAMKMSLAENDIDLENEQKVIDSFGRSSLYCLETAVKVSYAGSDLEAKLEKCTKSFLDIFPNKVISHFIVFPGVIESLRLLQNKNIRLVCYTGFDKAEADFFLDSMRLREYFETIVTADDVKRLRPDPEALLLAEKNWAVKLKNAFMLVIP